MMKKILPFLSITIVMQGCTAVPRMPDGSPDGIIQLADIVECEIIKTFNENEKETGAKFEKWAANYTITQNITQTDGAGLDPLTWITPTGVRKLNIVAGAGVAQEAYRNGKAEYSVFVREPKSRACERVAAYKDIKVEPRDFKLREWVSQISHQLQDKQLNNFSYSVRVQVTTSAGIGPDFESGKWKAIGTLSRERVTVKTVDFAFAPVPGKPKPTEVIVVAPIPERTRPAASIEKLVPRQRAHGARQGSGPAIVPQSVIIENRGITQGQQLDRVSPNGILDR